MKGVPDNRAGARPAPTAQARGGGAPRIVLRRKRGCDAPRQYPTVQLCDTIVRPRPTAWDKAQGGGPA